MQELLEWISNEKALALANGGGRKTTRTICDELAANYVREKALNGSAEKAGGRRLSATLASEAKTESARLKILSRKPRTAFGSVAIANA